MIRMSRIRTIRINLIQTRSRPSFLRICRYDLPLATIRPLISPTSPLITTTFWCQDITKNSKKGRVWWRGRTFSRYRKVSLRLALTQVLTMGPLPSRMLSLTKGRAHSNRITQMSCRVSGLLRRVILIKKTSKISPPIRSNHPMSLSSNHTILSTRVWVGLRITFPRFSMKMKLATGTLLMPLNWLNLWRTGMLWAKDTLKIPSCWGRGLTKLIIRRARPTFSVTSASRRKRRNQRMKNRVSKLALAWKTSKSARLALHRWEIRRYRH